MPGRRRYRPGVPIPDFEPTGLLPAGRHAATAEEVEERFVDAFPDSPTRRAIYTFWRAHREAVADLVRVHGQWLDGSFTTDKSDPADMDLVTIIDGPAFDELPRHRQLMVRALVNGTDTESFWSCDAQPLVHYPRGHPGHSKFVIAAERMESYYAHTREGGEKGFLEVSG